MLCFFKEENSVIYGTTKFPKLPLCYNPKAKYKQPPNISHPILPNINNRRLLNVYPNPGSVPADGEESLQL